ncbi:hypothetical protein ACFYO1_00935 [Nocardia sp. NPDC006044]|uniref:hypothetical protein n=1 Tax=Nocardia sp. NPDC006044 TaxID=3364306 RepID=UPI0036C9DE1F
MPPWSAPTMIPAKTAGSSPSMRRLWTTPGLGRPGVSGRTASACRGVRDRA